MKNFFGVITITKYIYSLEKCKKDLILFKLFWYKVFVHLKLTSLDIPMVSVF